MLADDFNYKIAAGLHRDRLAEAESIRLAAQAKRALKSDRRSLRVIIGTQLIALGEKLSE